MKKVCFVCWDFSLVGGIESVVTLLSEEFSKYYDVHVVSINNEKGKCNHKLHNNIKYCVINEGKNRIKSSCLKSFFPILKYITKNKIDVVFGMGNYTVPVLLPISKFSRAKFIFCDHGAISNQLDDSTTTKFRKIASRNFEKVVTLTERNEEDYINMFSTDPDKVICIHNCIDDKIFEFVSSSYNINSKKIMSVGRFGPEKGYDMLFDVANIVLKKHPDWQWDLYGNGETFEEIKQKIEKHKLKGRLNQKGLVNDIYERYKDYAIYVLPSYREGLPLVLLEAKANRLPVVSFDCVTGPREIITDGVDGFLIDCYNKQTMANKILDLIESNDLRIKMSKNSYINLDKFSKEKILNQWIELIEGI